MKATFIFGHRKPDTDSVCSAISLAYLKNALGFNTIPRILGDLNNETKFVLNYFHIKEPMYLNDEKKSFKFDSYCQSKEKISRITIHERYYE